MVDTPGGNNNEEETAAKLELERQAAELQTTAAEDNSTPAKPNLNIEPNETTIGGSADFGTSAISTTSQNDKINDQNLAAENTAFENAQTASENKNEYGFDVTAGKKHYDDSLALGEAALGKNNNAYAQTTKTGMVEEEKKKDDFARALAAMNLAQLQQAFEDLSQEAKNAIDDAQDVIRDIDVAYQAVQQSTWDAGEEFAREQQELQRLKDELEQVKNDPNADPTEIAALEASVEQQQQTTDLKKSVYEAQADILNDLDVERKEIQQEIGSIKNGMSQLENQLQGASPEEAEAIRQQIIDMKSEIAVLEQTCADAVNEAKQQQDLSNKITELSSDGNLSKADLSELKNMAGNDSAQIGTVYKLSLAAAESGMTIEGFDSQGGGKVSDFLSKEIAMYDLEQQEMENALRLQSDPENQELLNEQTELANQRFELDKLGFSCRMPAAYHLDEAWKSDEWLNADTIEEKNEIERNFMIESYTSNLSPELKEQYDNGEFTDQQILSAINDYYYGPSEPAPELITPENNVIIDDFAAVYQNESGQLYLETADGSTHLVADELELAPEIQENIDNQLAAGKTIAVKPMDGETAKVTTTQETDQADNWEATEALTFEADPDFIDQSAKVTAQIEGSSITREQLEEALSGADPDMVAKIEQSLERQGIDIQEPEDQLQQQQTADIKGIQLTPGGPVIAAATPINAATPTAPQNGVTPGIAPEMEVSFADSSAFAATNPNDGVEHESFKPTQVAEVTNASTLFGKAPEELPKPGANGTMTPEQFAIQQQQDKQIADANLKALQDANNDQNSPAATGGAGGGGIMG